jgi:hypothetical protein
MAEHGRNAHRRETMTQTNAEQFAANLTRRLPAGSSISVSVRPDGKDARVVFSGGRHGEHSLSWMNYRPENIAIHFQGYCESNGIQLADVAPVAGDEFQVQRRTEWKIHGNSTWGTGMYGDVTECSARDVTFYVRENIRGDHFMLSGGGRLALKEGRIPDGFLPVLDVAAPAEHLPWILELVTRVDAHDATVSERRKVAARKACTHAAFTMNTAPRYFENRRRAKRTS